MTKKQSDDPGYTDGPPEHHVAAWVRQWNKLRSPINSERAPPLTEDQRLHLEQLYLLVADDLRRLASTPKHRWLGDSSQDRVYALFRSLIEGLVGRREPLNTDGNLTGLLVTIAARRSIDQFRHERIKIDPWVPLPDDHAAPAETAIEERTATQDYEAAVLKATQAFWDTLPWPEREIMRLRHPTNGTHPRPFASIAAHLGPNYKPNTVQKIYARTLERTREHLRTLGLLDDEGAN